MLLPASLLVAVCGIWAATQSSGNSVRQAMVASRAAALAIFLLLNLRRGGGR